MYRFLCILMAAVGFGFDSATLAESPNLGPTIAEDIRPTPPPAAQSIVAEAEAIDIDPIDFDKAFRIQPSDEAANSAPQVAAEENQSDASGSVDSAERARRPKFEFSMVEDLEPMKQPLTANVRQVEAIDPKAIDLGLVFDFQAMPQASLPAPPLVVQAGASHGSEDVDSASFAQLTKLELVIVEDLQPSDPSATLGVIPHREIRDIHAIDSDQAIDVQPSDEAAPNEPLRVARIDNSTAFEEIGPGVALEEVIVDNAHQGVDNQEIVPHGVYNETYVDTTGRLCHDCNAQTPCNCQPKGEHCSRLKNCWHGTKLYHLHVRNLGHPGMFCERPFGVCNEAWAGAMIAAGKADRAMLHHYDFTHHASGSVQLTARGHRELTRIASLISEFPLPLSIESTYRPHEDAARRTAVINAIAQLGLPISPANVRLSDDPTIGLSGEEAQAIHAIRINEAITGASRTRPYRDSAAATIIPYASGERSKGRNAQ